VPLEVTMRAAITRERLDVARQSAQDTAASRLACALLDFYLAMATRLGSPSGALHDPLALAVACVPELVTTQRLHVNVELHGTHTRGQTVAYLSGRRERTESRGDYDDVVGVDEVEGNVDVAVDVDAERFLEFFLERILASPSGRGR